MLLKRRYKNLHRFGYPLYLKILSKLQGLHYCFSENFTDEIQRFTNAKQQFNFLIIPLSIIFLNPKILGFLFLY